MNQSVLSGKNGVIAQQQRLDTIANNIANVNTYGYKSTRTDFKDILYKTMLRPVQPQDDVNQLRGHGVVATASTRILTQGAIEKTGEALDVALEGPGYFAVQLPSGETGYSRDGYFAVSVEENGNYLVNGQGYYVLDENGQRINIPNDGSGIGISEDGYISHGTDAPLARLGMYNFPNSQGLNAVSENLFTQSESSGAPEAYPAGTKIIQGALEMSNVDLGEEFQLMIRTQRALQAASRAITTADSMDGVANTMRR